MFLVKEWGVGIAVAGHTDKFKSENITEEFDVSIISSRMLTMVLFLLVLTISRHDEMSNHVIRQLTQAENIQLFKSGILGFSVCVSLYF